MALTDIGEVTFDIQMLPHELNTLVKGEKASYTPGPDEHWWYQFVNCPTGTNSQLISIDSPLFSDVVADGDGELPEVVEALDVCKFLYISNVGTKDSFSSFTIFNRNIISPFQLCSLEENFNGRPKTLLRPRLAPGPAFAHVFISVAFSNTGV